MQHIGSSNNAHHIRYLYEISSSNLNPIPTFILTDTCSTIFTDERGEENYAEHINL